MKTSIKKQIIAAVILTASFGAMAQDSEIKYSSTPLGQAWAAGIVTIGGQVTAPLPTAPTNTDVGNGSILTSPGQLILSVFEDPTNYFGTNALRVGLLGIKSGSTYGAALDMHVPLLTNGQISAGIAVADIGNQLYNAALNINLEKTLHPFNMFGITNSTLTNFAVSVFAESGPDVIVKSGSIGSQTFGGLNWCTHLGPGHLSLIGVLGDISQLPRKVWGLGIEYSLHLGALGL